MNTTKKLGSLLAAFFSISLMSNIGFAEDVVIPSKISKDEVSGDIFKRASMIEKLRRNGTKTLDVSTNLSSDKKFETGMYKAGPSRFEIGDDGYGVDEFMYFLEGSVKLTSADGSVQIINAGEAVTIQKEWSGIWETEGYTKIYVIYNNKPAGDAE